MRCRLCRVRSWFKFGYAAQMGADPDEDSVLGLDRAVPIVRIGRLLKLFGLRVGELLRQPRFLQHCEHGRRTMDDKNRP